MTGRIQLLAFLYILFLGSFRSHGITCVGSIVSLLDIRLDTTIKLFSSMKYFHLGTFHLISYL
jgi:hypothetical protein